MAESVRVNLEKICRSISRYSPKLLLSQEEFSFIHSVTLLDKHQKQYERDILYIGEISDLPPISKLSYPVNILLCMEDDSVPSKYKVLKQVNWLLAKKCPNPSELLCDIKQLLDKQNQVLQDSLLLYNASLSGKGLQYIVDVAGDVFANPIWVADISFKVLAFTKNVSVTEPVWQKEIEKGYLSYHSINNARREGIISRVYQSEGPVILNFSQHRRLSERIIIDGKNAGFVSILECEKPFHERDVELVPLLCSILSNELKKDSLFKYNRGITYDTLIFDLLNEKAIPEEVLDSRLKYLDFKSGKYLYILNVRFLKYSQANLPLPYMRNALESRISRSTGVIYNDTIILLIIRDTRHPLFDCELDAVNTLLRENNMVAGFSLDFHRISDISKHYLQASVAIELGTRLDDSKSLFFYDDYWFYHLLSIVEDNIDIKIFCSRLLMQLLKYDRQNKTRFTESLYVYLCTGCNAAESARIFNIHRNSMDYRIKRIEELLDIKINDPVVSFSLSLSFKILLLIGEKDFINNDLLHTIMNRPSWN